MSTEPADTADAIDLAHAPRRGEPFDLIVSGLDADGHGLAVQHVRVGPQRAPRALRWSLRGCVPGDHVRVEAGGCRGTNAWGRVVELLASGPVRIPAPCPHYGGDPASPRGCGGCTMQTVPHAMQLDHKREIVRRHFAQHRVLRTVPVLPTLPADPPWRYRNKMEFSFGRDATGAFALGLHPGGYRHEVFGLRDCHLVSREGSALCAGIAAELGVIGLEPWRERDASGWLRTLTLRESIRCGGRLLELTTTGDESVTSASGVQSAAEAAGRFADIVASVSARLGKGHQVTSLWWTRHHARRGERTRLESVHLAGERELTDEIVLPGGRALRFDIAPRAFFQPNAAQAGVLYGQALDRALHGLPPGAHVLDLYCGTGTIGICAASRGARVTGIELVPDAVASAVRNAARNGVTDARFVAGDVATVLRAEGLDAPGTAQVVIVDPPRAGLNAEAIAVLLQIGAPRIVYVSCNPETLARDAALLVSGGYLPGAVQPVDMFPHTSHIENVMTFERSEPSA